MENDHYVTREEYAELLALARRRPGIWEMIVNTILWMSAGGAIAFAVLVFMPVGSDAPAPPAAPPNAKVSTTAPSGGAYTTSAGGGSLPPCSAVTDTRTACTQDQAEDAAPAGVAEEEQAQPTPTPEAPYASACQSVPGERPCWVAEGAAWQELQDVPETPLVLLPAPPLVFSDSACAAWRPPLVLPEGCEE